MTERERERGRWGNKATDERERRDSGRTKREDGWVDNGEGVEGAAGPQDSPGAARSSREVTMLR